MQNKRKMEQLEKHPDLLSVSIDKKLMVEYPSNASEDYDEKE